MTSSRTLELVNESPLAGRMGVYLLDPEAGDGRPLIWRSLDCGPGRSVRMEWPEDFGLTYGPPAEPGFLFSGGEIQPAGGGLDSFRLAGSASSYSLRPAASARDSDYVPEEVATDFILSLKPGEKRRSLADLVRDQPASPVPPGPAGRFQVLVEPGIGEVSVALCLAGRPALLKRAEPTGRALSFPARPRYGAVFGSFEPGQVLDLDQVLLTTELEFAGPALKAVFRRDCQWTVEPL